MARQQEPTTATRGTTASGRGRAASRPEPRRAPEHAHLTLAELRRYRHALRDEESRVSYWRRVFRSRLDRLSGTGLDRPDVARFGAVLDLAERQTLGRDVVRAVPVDGEPSLPDVGLLWAPEVDPENPTAYEDAVHGLALGERQLATYLESLQRRLERATSELIARYREDPSQCLVALPQGPGADGSSSLPL